MDDKVQGSVAEVEKADFAQRAVNNPSELFVIVDLLRPGAAEFAMYLENTHFDPDVPEKNALFMLYLSRWPDPTMVFATLQVPMAYRPEVEASAAQFDLHISPGIPQVIDKGGVHRFPLDDSAGNVFCIQGTWKEGRTEVQPGIFVRKDK